MRAFIISFTLVMFCIGQSWNVTAQTGANDGPLTNAAVVKLVKADVSEKIILAMLAHQQGFAFDESWNDDTFFSQGNGDIGRPIDKQKDPSMSQPDPGSTDIFGSSGGVRGSTQSRGGNGSSSGDTITTGSATVRILRPPTEAG